MPKNKRENGLTDRQDLFCQEYLKDLNGTNAAIRAGYAPSSAQVKAAQLLALPHIKTRVNELKTQRAQDLRIEANDVLREILNIAKSDIRDLYDESGELLHIHEIPDGTRKSIAGVDVSLDYSEGVNIGETRKIKLWDKMKALELLGRHLKLFTDKVEHTGKVTLEDLVSGSSDEEK